MADWEIRQGDTHPPIVVRLYEGENVANLTDCTVTWHMFMPGSASPAVVWPAAVLGEGRVSASPVQGDTDVPGQYLGVFKVTYPDSTKGTFPTRGYVSVQINASEV